MKLTHGAGELSTSMGSEVTIPLSLSVAPELRDPIQISIVPANDIFVAEDVALAAGQKETAIKVRVTNQPAVAGEQELRIRATALRDGKWPVVAETTVLVTLKAQ